MMDFTELQLAIAKARKMIRLVGETSREEFWKGYIQGVMMAYSGVQENTHKTHNKLLALVEELDELSVGRGFGYRAGLKKGGYIKVSRRIA